MNKTDNLAFWKSYCQKQVFMCSNCGTMVAKVTHTCPKCKRGMVNVPEENKK